MKEKGWCFYGNYKSAMGKSSKKKALDLFEKAGIVLTETEKENIEIADFGLEDLERIGWKSLHI